MKIPLKYFNRRNAIISSWIVGIAFLVMLVLTYSELKRSNRKQIEYAKTVKVGDTVLINKINGMVGVVDSIDKDGFHVTAKGYIQNINIRKYSDK